MPFRNYTFSVASAATASGAQFVGVHERAFLVVSGMTAWAAGTTNETITIRGGLSATDTHAAITSMTVTTFTVKGVYPLPYPGLPYMTIGLTSATTSTASINVVVYTDDL